MGSSNPIVNQLEFNYYGGEDPHYSVDRMGTATGEILFHCENGHGRMILNEGETFKAISSSIVLGAMADGAGLNIKPYLIAEIVNYFMRIVVNPLTPGDSNCDGMVNVLDVIATINFILSLNPDPFCFENADVNSDNIVNVIDVVGTINIILGSKSALIPGLTSDVAHLYLNNNSIDFYSDGTVAGLQFEIAGANTWNLELIPNGYEFLSNVVDGKLRGLIFSFDNTPLPAGNISLFKVSGATDLQWGDVTGANINAQEVKIVKHLQDGSIVHEPLRVSAYPNPAKDLINVDANQQIESIRIFNQLGQSVYASQVQTMKTSIHIANLITGVYVLAVRASGNLTYQKIVIE
jgi:hypothetical protein